MSSFAPSAIPFAYFTVGVGKRARNSQLVAFAFPFRVFGKQVSLRVRRIGNLAGACCALAIIKGHLVSGWQPNDSVKQLLSYSIICSQQEEMFLEILFSSLS